MANATRKLTTALAVSATLLTARAATVAGASDRAPLVLHVDDFSRLPSDELAVAEKLARRSLATADTRTVWSIAANGALVSVTRCSSKCSCCRGKWPSTRSPGKPCRATYSVRL